MAAAFETFKDIGILSSKECPGTLFEDLRIWAPIAPLLDLGSPHAIFPLIFISDIKSLQNKSSLIYAEPCMSAFLTASRTETAYAVLGFLFNDRVRLLQ